MVKVSNSTTSGDPPGDVPLPGRCSHMRSENAMSVKILGFVALIVSGLILCLIAARVYAFIPISFKITDPYHPWFRPDNFRFEDYTAGTCVEKEVLAKLFPEGTSKSFVERVLVKAGGAEVNPSKTVSHQVNYFYEPQLWESWFVSDPWSVAVSYDGNDKVVAISIPASIGDSDNVYSFFQDCKFGKQYGRKWQ